MLHVLPTAFVDRELPLEIRGVQEHKDDAWKVVRTFVGRTELLSPEREAEITETVETLATEAAPGRALAEAALERYGRFAVPYLTRASAMADAPATKARIERALASLTLRR